MYSSYRCWIPLLTPFSTLLFFINLKFNHRRTTVCDATDASPLLPCVAGRMRTKTAAAHSSPGSTALDRGHEKEYAAEGESLFAGSPGEADGAVVGGDEDLDDGAELEVDPDLNTMSRPPLLPITLFPSSCLICAK